MLLAHEILAGDAEMGAAGGELRDDLGGRQEQHLDVGHAGERAAIVARAARLREDEPGAGEEGGGVLLQPALDGTARTSGPRRLMAPLRDDAVEPERAADGRDRLGAPRCCSRPVVAAAADDGLAVGAPRDRAISKMKPV